MVVPIEKAQAWLQDAMGLRAGEDPFPWQTQLLDHIIADGLPGSLDIPTGLGKTSVMAIWLIARACGAPVPRRLVYVVDRRAVVDQATEVAIGLREFVARSDEVRKMLSIAGDLPISTLRGQHVDNRAWLNDPSSPAIVVGTVDMVGSRLLFSGYGVSSKMRPYHAGLLGADTLVVLDEAHLVPPFEDLLRQVERGLESSLRDGAESLGPSDSSLREMLPPFKLLSLSATGRHTDSKPLTLTDADRLHPIVSKRLTAKKTLAVVELGKVEEALAEEDGKSAHVDAEGQTAKTNKGPKLSAVLAKHAWDLTDEGAVKVRCLVFCNARKDAEAVADELRARAKSATATKPIVDLLVGSRRVCERTMVAAWLVEHGFVVRKDGTRSEPAGPTFLVATSAGEVGVDMDADHMVCDLVAWERMVQRLGRVNRRGEGDAKVIVVVGSEPAPSDGTKKALEKRDASTDASEQLDELTRKLSTLQEEKTTVPKGQKKSAEAKASEDRRTQAEKELKKSISAQKNRIKAFKDGDAKLVAHHEAEVAQYRALRRLLQAVEDGDGSLSPDALLCLREREDLAEAVLAATTVEQLRPELTRALIDSWSMTSLEEHAGRPDVDPWLRGFRPGDPPQTKVVWRRYLPVRAEGAFEPKSAKRFFEAAPPHTSEELETESYRVLDWLIDRAVSVSEAKDVDHPLAPKQVVSIALGARGELRGWHTLAELAGAKGKGKKESKDEKKAREQAVKQLEGVLAGATLVVDARLGGLVDGLLSGKAEAVAVAADDNSGTWLARPDAVGVPVTGFRIRELGAEEEGDADTAWATTPGGGWVRRHLFVTKLVGGDPSMALAIDGWVGDAATEDDRAEADRSQQLKEHQDWAAECAREIARRLGLDRRYEDLLALSARLHDGGKDAPRWQGAFRAPTEGRPYAKTKGPIDFDLLDGYRHELGSLPSVEADDEFKTLGADDRDFVLHLIAAHHGFGRPVIGTSGCDDAPPSVIEQRARTVALRFARLSRRWGPWGLAWWEALMRAADQTASRRNQHPATARKERP